MARHRSLIVLALLACFVRIGVDAQGSPWSKPASPQPSQGLHGSLGSQPALGHQSFNPAMKPAGQDPKRQLSPNPAVPLSSQPGFMSTGLQDPQPQPQPQPQPTFHRPHIQQPPQVLNPGVPQPSSGVQPSTQQKVQLSLMPNPQPSFQTQPIQRPPQPQYQPAVAQNPQPSAFSKKQPVGDPQPQPQQRFQTPQIQRPPQPQYQPSVAQNPQPQSSQFSKKQPVQDQQSQPQQLFQAPQVQRPPQPQYQPSVAQNPQPQPQPSQYSKKQPAQNPQPQHQQRPPQPQFQPSVAQNPQPQPQPSQYSKKQPAQNPQPQHQQRPPQPQFQPSGAKNPQPQFSQHSKKQLLQDQQPQFQQRPPQSQYQPSLAQNPQTQYQPSGAQNPQSRYQPSVAQNPQPQYQPSGAQNPQSQYQPSVAQNPQPQYQPSGAQNPQSQYQPSLTQNPQPQYQPTVAKNLQPQYQPSGAQNPQPQYQPSGAQNPQPQYQPSVAQNPQPQPQSSLYSKKPTFQNPQPQQPAPSRFSPSSSTVKGGHWQPKKTGVFPRGFSNYQTPQEPQQPQQPQQPQDPQPQQPSQPQMPIHQPKVPLAPPVSVCEVSAGQRVPCGGADISAAACEAISCCFDGQQCYFGRAVTVHCTRDAQFVVVVARDVTLPNIDLESMSLLGEGQGCTHVDSNSAFAIYQFPVTACGSMVMEESGIITYENRMFSSFEVGVGDYGAITRDSHYELMFQCRYTGTTVESVVVEVLPIVDPPPSVAALGPIRVELRLANGQCYSKGCNELDSAYTSFYTDGDYPVSKVLREPVYVEVQLMDRTDPNLVLTLGRCWTTQGPNPHSLPQWDILVDGCPYRDDRYLSSVIPVDASTGFTCPTHFRRFLFKMFTFVDTQSFTPMREQIYIHCSTAVCSGGHCEPSCLRRKRDVSAVKESSTPRIVASSGPVIFGVSEDI